MPFAGFLLIHTSIWSTAEDISRFIRHAKLPNASLLHGWCSAGKLVLQLSAENFTFPTLRSSLRVCLKTLHSPSPDSIAFPHGSNVAALCSHR